MAQKILGRNNNMENTELYPIQSIRALERLAVEQYGMTEAALMERAGQAAFRTLKARWPLAKKILVFCGKGNNGGDGCVLASLAKQQRLDVSIRQLGNLEELPVTAKRFAKECNDLAVEVKAFSADEVVQADVIVDALLGIGISGEVKGDYQQAISVINASALPVLAIDVPSGLNADTGASCGIAVNATVTITFIARKPGLFTGQGLASSGHVICDALGLPESAFDQIASSAHILSFPKRPLLAKRTRNAHKGLYGHVLIIGGNEGMPGAPHMAGEAALRIGAGLVTVITRPEHVGVICATRPELMCVGVDVAESAKIDPLLQKATTIVIGPGLGQDEWAQHFLDKIAALALPMVVDADALNLIAKTSLKSEHFILTPHPGEAARLLGIPTAEVQKDRYKAASDIQKKYDGVCVLKGAGSIVQAENQLAEVCIAGNPGMASAGMGDVLSGVIGGLLAQGLSPARAASLGVFIHANSGDQAASQGGERGLLASDLMPYLRSWVNT
jgi:ADP-dependent NAD(P)H-hydrate dehydratase / NAD(P)H-hydrate epimerase